MKITQVLVESAGATVAFAFGRFNPAHQGHIEVWRAVEEAGANWFIGTNPSTLGPNDPLTFEQKSAWMEEIYPPISGHIVPQTTVLSLAAYIFKKLRKNENATVAYVTDATDWAWSGKLLNQYNGVEGSHGYYKFAEIVHVPSPRVSSATALRDAARADDKVAFYHAGGTDPKSKVAGLTYFDTVKQACEKYPLPVKKAKKVKEAPDANFVGFMNKAMDTRQDKKPLAYDPKTVMSMDTMPGFKKAFKFGMDVIKKMDPDTKQEFANAPDDTLFSYMMNIAEKKGYVPEHFMSEDLDEVTGEFEEIFHDPDMEGWTWTDLLRDMIGMEPRALSKANVQAHKKEFSHAQQMAAKGPGPIDPNKLKAVTRSDTKQTEIWYPINPNYEAGGWVVVATGFQNKEQAEQKLTQMQQDPGINKQIQAALDKKKNESVNQGVAEDDEQGEVKKQGQLIPWPAGTTKVHVSDVYDWYKLGQVISDLDDANPADFGQGAPETVIAFGSEEEESKLLPLLKRLGLRVDDIDPEGADLDEAYHAGALYEYLKKATKQGVVEANPNQQFALWHPETKSYKGSINKIPTSDYAGDNDITTNYRKVDNFKHSEVNPLHKGDDSIEKAERNVNREQLTKLVKAAFNILTPEEKEVLNYRFWHDMTLDSIAQKMSISGSRVRQIEAQAFRKLKKSSNLTPVGESTEQKTVAKTWDQMTAQEKISGVKGRTVWNEKTQRYYTVFDVPAKQTTDEASLATMRDYFAGDEQARDPYEITKQRLHFSKDKDKKPTVDKRFRSQEEYEQWLIQNHLKHITPIKEDENINVSFDEAFNIINK
jgi:RNA polymerase sigma factor (sigma-70 family)